MKHKKGNQIKQLNIGKRIQEVLNLQKTTDAEIARQLSRNQSTVGRLTRGTSLQAYIIWEFSLALKHNFFAELAQQFDEATNGAGITSPQARIAELEKQKSDLELQVKTLKEALELVGRK